MSAETITRQTPAEETTNRQASLAEQTAARQTSAAPAPASETVQPQADHHDVVGHHEPWRSPATSAQWSSPAEAATLSFAGRRQLATPYIQGDFASGQRTLPHPVAAVGTFATR